MNSLPWLVFQTGLTGVNTHNYDASTSLTESEGKEGRILVGVALMLGLDQGRIIQEPTSIYHTHIYIQIVYNYSKNK